ncbi:hypothetical protein SCLCIDRAFT_1222373 [Scleroderma citrinum Foug A]|uniref:Uncharacterized protein n=1 Tax=Scleroderma citrinum Foug A TaxID=1036808 RepID=A0A0C3DC12_9AGAM|nr:hypothetical protein SCLCIDRAFT_1222373 [Scleroderma citrinum Foug A]
MVHQYRRTLSLESGPSSPLSNLPSYLNSQSIPRCRSSTYQHGVDRPHCNAAGACRAAQTPKNRWALQGPTELKYGRSRREMEVGSGCCHGKPVTLPCAWITTAVPTESSRVNIHPRSIRVQTETSSARGTARCENTNT